MTSSTGPAVPSTMTEEDKQNFAKLDEASNCLRAAAYDMAVLLYDLSEPQKTPEIKLLTMAVSKISTTEIQSLDLAFTNLKKAMATISMRNDNDLPFGKTISGDELGVMLAAYQRVLGEALEMAKKAQEMSAGLPD
jgi:hypothetical protein